MANKKSLKSAIIASVIAMVLSVTTLFGTTFAWFTDSVTNTNNIIKSGNLDVELSHSNTFGYDEKIGEVVKGDTKLFLNDDGEQILWEPGVKTDETFRIQNMGTLALKYEFRVKSAFETVVDGKKLSDVLSIEVKSDNLDETVAFGNGYVMEGTLKANESVDYYVAIVWNPSAIDNEYNVAGGLSMVLAIDLVATQTNVEKDGFNGSDYDLGATYSESKYAFPSEDLVLPDNATESETLTTISESPVSVEVPASLLNKLKANGVTKMKVATTKPQVDTNNKTVSFESIELFDQNGKVIDLETLNLGEEVEVTLPIDNAAIENNYPVTVMHDGKNVGTATVKDGEITYTAGHFCKVEVAIKEVKTAEELKAALRTDEVVILGADITINATESNAYGKTAINVFGKELDGKGYTLKVEGANGTWDTAISITAGTIKNLAIDGGFRGVFINHNNSSFQGKVVLDNVVIENSVYTISCDQGTNGGLEVINSTIKGWTSFAATLGDAKFVDCYFGEGNGYAFCRPYAPTEFIGCEFEAGYELDARADVSFENCTLAGEVITIENVANFASGNVTVR